MRQKTWLIVLTASILSLLLLFSGFVMSVRDVSNPPEKEVDMNTDKENDIDSVDPGSHGTFNFVALGDSLTRGMGDENGKGFVGVLQGSLEQEHDRVIVHNYGVRGATLPELLEQVEQTEIRRTIEEASVITVTIGGNDLFDEGMLVEGLDLEKMEDIQSTAIQNIDQLFDVIRSITAETPIVFVGLYNPFPDLEEAKTVAKIVHDWNYQVSLKANEYENIAVVPTYDIIRDPEEDLYSDHFHPNSKSYERIAERILETLK